MSTARSGAAVVRQTRLWLGLVLFTYLTTHFLNHALGLISLDAMAVGREWFLLLWRSRAGTVALYTALFVHLSLGYWSLYRRRTLRMPGWEGLGPCSGESRPQPGWWLVGSVSGPGTGGGASL